jgi:hypothetical protein
MVDFVCVIILYDSILQYHVHFEIFFLIIKQIRVITKLPNSEQSYKGKVKTHNYIFSCENV